VPKPEFFTPIQTHTQMAFHDMIEINRKYILLHTFHHEDDVYYQIIVDSDESLFGCGHWRNTAEKVEQLRSMGLLQKFGEFENCLTLTSLMTLVLKGWTTNYMKDVIDVFRQRIQQHESVKQVLLDTMEDKVEQISKLREIIKMYESNY
jgi:hypothetical protein